MKLRLADGGSDLAGQGAFPNYFDDSGLADPPFGRAWLKHNVSREIIKIIRFHKLSRKMHSYGISHTALNLLNCYASIVGISSNIIYLQ